MGLFAFIPAVIGIPEFSAFPNIDPNKALSTIVFSKAPQWILGLVCAAISVSTMSNADSDMLCASTIITKDLYQKYINVSVSEKKMIRSTGPFAAFILGITLKKCSKHLGIISILVGSVVGIYWQIMNQPLGILPIVAGAVASIITFFIVSYIEIKVNGKMAQELN